MQIIRVLVADGHPIFRRGLLSLLENAHGVTCIGEAEDGLQALQLARELAPNVLVLDVEMPEMDGVEVAARLQAERLPVRVLALSAHDDCEFVQGLLAAGAAGYLLKDEAPERIVKAIYAVAHGDEGWLSPRVAAKLVHQEQEACPLTPRQLEVLRLVAKGQSNREIASALAISVKMVERHLADINLRLKTSSRTEAAMQAQRRGLLRRLCREVGKTLA